MFSNVENLEPAKHAHLRFKPANDYGFSSKLASVPLSATEITEATRFYPLVFSTEGPLLPVALLSLEDGHNAYLDDNGKWRAPYIPAHVRRYPFILGATEQADRFTVMADMDAPHFASGDGEPLYTESGEKAEVLKGAMEFLQIFQQELEATEKLLAPLSETGVLSLQSIDIALPDGEKASFNGLRVVDQKKLMEQDDATLAAWVRNGLMGVIYAHAGSLRNLMFLREKATPQTDEASPQQPAGTPSSSPQSNNPF